MAIVVATATPVTFLENAGLRVMRWDTSVAPLARLRRECATLAECRALHDEVEAEARAAGGSFMTGLRLASGRKPRGFDALAEGVRHDDGDAALAA